MIGYLDTSALVPLVIEEPSSELSRRFWDDADIVLTSRLLYVEAAVALAQAHRMERISESQRRKGLAILDDLWAEMDIVEIDHDLSREAANLAHRHALRGYDAVHCASAVQVNDEDLVAASGDARLLAAWHQLAIATYDVNSRL